MVPLREAAQRGQALEERGRPHRTLRWWAPTWTNDGALESVADADGGFQ